MYVNCIVSYEFHTTPRRKYSFNENLLKAPRSELFILETAPWSQSSRTQQQTRAHRSVNFNLLEESAPSQHLQLSPTQPLSAPFPNGQPTQQLQRAQEDKPQLQQVVQEADGGDGAKGPTAFKRAHFDEHPKLCMP